MPDYLNPNVKNINLQFEQVDYNKNKLEGEFTEQVKSNLSNSNPFLTKNSSEGELDLNKTHKNVKNLLVDNTSAEESGVDFHSANVELLGFIEQNDRQFDKINQLKEALGGGGGVNGKDKNKNNSGIVNKLGKKNSKKLSESEKSDAKDKDKDAKDKDAKDKNSVKYNNNITVNDIQNENINNKVDNENKFNN